MTTETAFSPSFLLAPPVALDGTSLSCLFSHPDQCLIQDASFLLAPLYALRSDGVKAEYHAQHARHALLDFLERLPGGRADYLAAVGQMGQHLFTLAAKHAEKAHVLDATFCNHYIIDELTSLFPNANLVEIRVDPITYLSASIRNECGGQPDRLTFCDKSFRELYGIYQQFAKTPELFGARRLALSYEQLVIDPAEARAQAFKHLGLSPATMPDALPQLESPMAHLTYWQSSPWRHRFIVIARDYLQHLGSELLADQGWHLPELEHRLIMLEAATGAPQ